MNDEKHFEVANPLYRAIHPKGTLKILGVMVGSFMCIRK